MQVVSIILLAAVIWGLALTWLYLRLAKTFKTIKVGADGPPLLQLLESQQTKIARLEEKIAQQDKNHQSLAKESQQDLAQVGYVRFNPFDDAGSDQSFSLALLNRSKDGFVLTSMHGRSGTRVYLKPVKGGKEEKYQLSDEETQAISNACFK